MGAGHSRRRGEAPANDNAERQRGGSQTAAQQQQWQTGQSPYNYPPMQQQQRAPYYPNVPPYPMQQQPPQQQQQQQPYYNHNAQPSYTQQAQTQKTSTIRNDVNVKKKTLEVHEDERNPNHLVLSFTFDAAAPCSVSVFFNAHEDVHEACMLTQLSGAQPHPRVDFDKGLGQVYKLNPSFSLDLSTVAQKDLLHVGPEHYPLCVRLETIKKDTEEEHHELPQPPGCALPKWVQAQTTYATLVKGEDGKYMARVLKQKIWVDGTSYELQEIYGIEGSAGGSGGAGGDECGKECVICMSEQRDTTVLPCRHMCMCSGCAKLLRHQTNRCPICRTMVEGLLEIKVESKRT
mmetsp:Transcript_38907/g.65428  ORF Transcript_38907/g.65428 Transcript_38907/m.65428 type:complete len:347 (-) Transcript_38907:146-1186(-)